MVDLSGIRSRICMRSFLIVRCVLRKPWAFFEKGPNNPNNRRSDLGPFPGPKSWKGKTFFISHITANKKLQRYRHKPCQHATEALWVSSWVVCKQWQSAACETPAVLTLRGGCHADQRPLVRAANIDGIIFVREPRARNEVDSFGIRWAITTPFISVRPPRLWDVMLPAQCASTGTPWYPSDVPSTEHICSYSHSQHFQRPLFQKVQIG